MSSLPPSPSLARRTPGTFSSRHLFFPLYRTWQRPAYVTYPPFAAAVLDGEAQLTGGEDGIANMRVIDAV